MLCRFYLLEIDYDARTNSDPIVYEGRSSLVVLQPDEIYASNDSMCAPWCQTTTTRTTHATASGRQNGNPNRANIQSETGPKMPNNSNDLALQVGIL